MTGTRFTPEVHPQLPKKIARMQELANDLLDIIEKEVIPLYYQRNGHGYSEGWVRMSKNSMRTCIPKFNSLRMLMDYIKQFYGPAARQLETRHPHGLAQDQHPC